MLTDKDKAHENISFLESILSFRGNLTMGTLKKRFLPPHKRFPIREVLGSIPTAQCFCVNEVRAVSPRQNSCPITTSEIIALNRDCQNIDHHQHVEYGRTILYYLSY
uniref:Uncharacterized protein n=1 Tax=Cacopsylla melanoneura TaxID=428564 RepID=A0A8D8ZDA4_9HEMI